MEGSRCVVALVPGFSAAGFPYFFIHGFGPGEVSYFKDSHELAVVGFVGLGLVGVWNGVDKCLGDDASGEGGF